MLDAVMRYLPSPYDIGDIVGHEPDDEEEQVVRHSDPDEPFCRFGVQDCHGPLRWPFVFRTRLLWNPSCWLVRQEHDV